MAVLINLLPDIKQQRLKIERRKRMISLAGLGIMAVGVGLPVLLGLGLGGQQVLLNNAREANEKGINELSSIENINEIVTAKNQLDAIYSLRDSGQDYIGFLETIEASLPPGTQLSALNINDLGELEMTGTVPTLIQVDVLVKSLSSYTPDGIVIDRFNFDSTPFINNIRIEGIDPSTGDGVSFSLVGQFDFALLEQIAAEAELQAEEGDEASDELDAGADEPEELDIDEPETNPFDTTEEGTDG